MKDGFTFKGLFRKKKEPIVFPSTEEGLREILTEQVRKDLHQNVKSSSSPTPPNRSSSSSSSLAENGLKLKVVGEEEFRMLPSSIKQFIEAQKELAELNFLLGFREINAGYPGLVKAFGEENLGGKAYEAKPKTSNDAPIGLIGLIPTNQNLSKNSQEIKKHFSRRQGSSGDSTSSEEREQERLFARLQNLTDAIINFEKPVGLWSQYNEYKKANPLADKLKGFTGFLQKKIQEEGGEYLKELVKFDYKNLFDYESRQLKIPLREGHPPQKIFYLASKNLFNNRLVAEFEQVEEIVDGKLETKNKMIYAVKGIDGIYHQIIQENGEWIPDPSAYSLPAGTRFKPYEVLYRNKRVIGPDDDLMCTAETNPYERTPVPKNGKYGFVTKSQIRLLESKALRGLYRLGRFTHGPESFNRHVEVVRDGDKFYFVTPGRKKEDIRLIVAEGMEGLLQMLNIYKTLCFKHGHKHDMRLNIHYAYGIALDEKGNLVVNAELKEVASRIQKLILSFSESSSPYANQSAEILTNKIIKCTSKFVRSFQKEDATEQYLESMRDIRDEAERRQDIDIKKRNSRSLSKYKSMASFRTTASIRDRRHLLGQIANMFPGVETSLKNIPTRLSNLRKSFIGNTSKHGSDLSVETLKAQKGGASSIWRIIHNPFRKRKDSEPFVTNGGGEGEPPKSILKPRKVTFEKPDVPSTKEVTPANHHLRSTVVPTPQLTTHIENLPQTSVVPLTPPADQTLKQVLIPLVTAIERKQYETQNIEIETIHTKAKEAGRVFIKIESTLDENGDGTITYRDPDYTQLIKRASTNPSANIQEGPAHRSPSEVADPTKKGEYLADKTHNITYKIKNRKIVGIERGDATTALVLQKADVVKHESAKIEFKQARGEAIEVKTEKDLDKLPNTLLTNVSIEQFRQRGPSLSV